MKVVVTGCTGNVGTSVVAALAGDPEVSEIVGVARRVPSDCSELSWFVPADVVRDPLEPIFDGADAVIHLAWAIQPARDRALTRAVNVDGSRRVFEAAARAGVKTLVHASSIGAYGPGPEENVAVSEDWPTTGIGTSFYSVDKAAAEGILDEVEAANPELRVVRLRPALIFKRNAGSEIRRLFAGPLLPNALARPDRLPIFPWVTGLRAQAVHSDDVADAYRRAVLTPDARGAFNIAADPVLDSESIAEALGVRVIEMPARALRPLAAATWRMHLQPTPPGWLDMAVQVPLIDSSRARDELGWSPRHGAGKTLRELLAGIADRDGSATPPLERDTYGRARVEELFRGGPDRG